jgi:hypothetical protein
MADHRPVPVAVLLALFVRLPGRRKTPPLGELVKVQQARAQET